VDEDDGYRAFVRSVLEHAGHEVQEAASGEEALEALRRSPPSLALLDVRLPAMSGYEVCSWIRRELAPSVGVMFVSGDRTDACDRAAGLMLGADDYLTKPFTPEELLTRVRVLLRRAAAPRLPALTPRELEVLRLLAQGMEQAEIAERLVISPKTVRSHLEHILPKLGVHTRAQAVALAYRESLVT
jgi:DNA-binding NarL/FixJ family response regulator